jgi:hypothetical protein
MLVNCQALSTIDYQLVDTGKLPSLIYHQLLTKKIYSGCIKLYVFKEALALNSLLVEYKCLRCNTLNQYSEPLICLLTSYSSDLYWRFLPKNYTIYVILYILYLFQAVLKHLIITRTNTNYNYFITLINYRLVTI